MNGEQKAGKQFRLGIDTGGTFTDLCLFDESSGRFEVAKISSTPADPSEAVIAGIKKLLAGRKLAPEQIRFLIHGTTVATNALLEGKGALAALITTEGFEDVLHIGRQSRPRLYDFWAKRPRPLVPRSRCYGVSERVLYTGEVLKSLEEKNVRTIIKDIKNSGINSIAVSLINSYANPEHEHRIQALIDEIHPEAYVTLSVEVLPEFREYERISTICINAYVMPKVNAYVAHLENMLKKMGVASDLYIMQSNGGVITARMARQMSARTVLSGPAGGALTGVFLANAIDEPNVITIDMGGTSSDICLIKDREPHLTTEADIEGYPIKLPMIDINTIGAGGGSVAWIDAGGALRVGPRSAGADPGPVCYGRGGSEPTVTDANAILGRLNPAYILGGEMALDLDLAKKTLEKKIARPLGIDMLRAAEGIIAVVNANMVRGIRRVSVERGHDPRDFALVPFGGAGPLHGVELARALNIPHVIVPAYPGIASAFGMLSADVRHDYVQTHVRVSDQADVNRIEALYADMEAQGTAQLGREGFSGPTALLLRYADMRYLRQAYELSIPLTEGRVTRDAAATLVERFHKSHETAYGYTREKEPVEFVNLRVVALGKLPAISVSDKRQDGSTPSEPTGRRGVVFDGRFVESAIFRRDLLLHEQVVSGPAVLEQLDSTILVPPEYGAVTDQYGNLHIRQGDVS